MAHIAMVQDSEGSPVFNPLCVIDEASLSTYDVISVITEAYRQTIPGHVVDYIFLKTSYLDRNKYRILVVEQQDCVDDEGHDYIEYRTFALIVTVQFVPTFGYQEV